MKSAKVAYSCRRRSPATSPLPSRPSPKSPLSKLTAREIEILRLLSAGESLTEIAWMVHSSYKTIANTSSIMRQKLGVRTSTELVRLAIESRLTSDRRQGSTMPHRGCGSHAAISKNKTITEPGP